VREHRDGEPDRRGVEGQLRAEEVRQEEDKDTAAGNVGTGERHLFIFRLVIS
jgi:hypothetical protein